MVSIKVSKDNSISRGLIGRTSFMLDEIESKTVHKEEEGRWIEGKEVRH